MNLYTYRAKIVSVYDGDTCRADIDLGFGIIMRNKTLRLLGIDTPELRGEERERGLVSRDYLRDLVLEKDVLIETYKDKSGKYGRILATIWLDEENINEKLITEGYAEKYE